MYGLIGNPLSHSFSKKYFENKFRTENIADAVYNLFEIKRVEQVLEIIEQNPGLAGLNVTIPYKEAIIPYLHSLDETAKMVGAVNVIKIVENSLIGYNSDFYGFEKTLFGWLSSDHSGLKVLILGSGGAAKAVRAVLTTHNISYTSVSRKKSSTSITYSQLKDSEITLEHRLIINTSPVGMTPNINEFPDIIYNQITSKHYVFDLIYNPKETAFLRKTHAQGAQTKNGMEMLKLQAERSWEIWTS